MKPEEKEEKGTDERIISPRMTMLKSKRRVTVSSRLTAGIKECMWLFIVSSVSSRHSPTTKRRKNAPTRLLLRRNPIDELMKRRRVRQTEENRKSVGPAELEAESEEGEEDEVERGVKGSKGLLSAGDGQ
jgi:hypothetical protein